MKLVRELIIVNNYQLYTTRSCIICERVQKLIKSQQLNVEVIEAEDRDIISFREMNIRSFPVLKLNENEYIYGVSVGNYIAMHIEDFRIK